MVELPSRYDGWLQPTDRAALTAYVMAWSTFEVAAMDGMSVERLVARREIPTAKS